MMGGKERQEFAFTKTCRRQLPSWFGIAKAFALSVIHQWRFEISAQRSYIALDGARGTTGTYRQILDGRAAARANRFVELLQARQGAHMYTWCVIGLLALHMTSPVKVSQPGFLYS